MNSSPIYKTTWGAGQGLNTGKCNVPGIYLLLPGSNSCWAGFKSVNQAKTCLNVLPGWKLHVNR